MKSSIPFIVLLWVSTGITPYLTTGNFFCQPPMNSSRRCRNWRSATTMPPAPISARKLTLALTASSTWCCLSLRRTLFARSVSVLLVGTGAHLGDDAAPVGRCRR